MMCHSINNSVRIFLSIMAVSTLACCAMGPRNHPTVDVPSFDLNNGGAVMGQRAVEHNPLVRRNAGSALDRRQPESHQLVRRAVGSNSLNLRRNDEVRPLVRTNVATHSNLLRLNGVGQRIPSGAPRVEIQRRGSILSALRRHSASGSSHGRFNRANAQGAYFRDGQAPGTNPVPGDSYPEGTDVDIREEAYLKANNEQERMVWQERLNQGQRVEEFNRLAVYDEFIASIGRDVTYVRALLQAQGPVNTTELLMTASSKGDLAVVKILLEHGANPDAVTSDGISAQRIANLQGLRNDWVLFGVGQTTHSAMQLRDRIIAVLDR